MTTEVNSNSSGVVVTASAMTATDMVSQQKQQQPTVANPVVTAVAMTATDVELQQKQQQPATADHSVCADRGDDAVKGMEIAICILLIVGFIFSFFFPIVSFICLMATIAIAFTITCGCCGASDYHLKPNVKRSATATLVSLCLMIIVQIIAVIAVLASLGTEFSNTGTISTSTGDKVSIGLILLLAFSYLLYVMAIIFSALFTWGRGCGDTHS